MAQNKKGIFKKIMNVIGIVDDGPRDADDEYEGGYSRARASRGSTYVPQQRVSRTEETRRRSVVPDERGSRYGATQTRASYANDEGYTVRRSTRAYDDDYSEPVRSGASSRRTETRRPSEQAPSARSSSRFSGESVAAVATVPRQSPMSARTIMFSITSLEECCDVIDSLIANNIVLLTLDELDSKLTQRAVDTLSGAVFALHATIRKASDKTYLIAPRSVEVNETYDVERRF